MTPTLAPTATHEQIRAHLLDQLRELLPNMAAQWWPYTAQWIDLLLHAGVRLYDASNSLQVGDNLDAYFACDPGERDLTVRALDGELVPADLAVSPTYTDAGRPITVERQLTPLGWARALLADPQLLTRASTLIAAMQRSSQVGADLARAFTRTYAPVLELPDDPALIERARMALQLASLPVVDDEPLPPRDLPAVASACRNPHVNALVTDPA